MSVKNIYICAFFATVLLSSVSYGDINVLTNPGFETGDTAGWSTFYDYGSISAVTSPVHSGSYAGRVYNRDGWWYGLKQDLVGKMKIGETYTISAWARTNNSADSDLSMYIVKTDFSGTNFELVDGATINNSGWVELSGSFPLTDVNGVLAELFLFLYGPDPGIDFYIDDANVYGPKAPPPTGAINANVRHQILDGFGASGAWYENWLTGHPKRNELYDLLFGQLGLDIYRLRNTYDQATGGGSEYMSRSAQIISAGQATLEHPLKIMISSWSPPAYLKSNNSLIGGTLLKNDIGTYKYEQFAQWWYDSLDAWSSLGVDADYINIQNEPNWVATWDTCLFNPTESSTCAGYNTAFETVWQKLNTEMGSAMPKMLAAEVRNMYLSEDYLDNLIEPAHAYGYSHHLYGDTSWDNPDGAIPRMNSFNTKYGYKPLMQTEFAKDGDISAFSDVMNLAILMHNSLAVEEASAYLHWELFWQEPKGLVGFPSYASSGYTINPPYYAFKHYSAFVHSGWQRVEASTNYYNPRISAYISPDNNELSAVIINTATDNDIDINLPVTGFIIEDATVYRTSETENCVAVGSFNPADSLTLPAWSITTIALSADETISPPSPPMNLSTIVGKDWVSLDWDDNPETDVNGYNIYRATTPGSGYSKVNGSLVADSNYVDHNIESDTTYYYVVTAVDNYHNEGPYSSEEIAIAYDGNFARFYFCSFENGWEGWTNVTGDDADWLYHKDITPTSRTGPDSGANDSTWYAYLETSSDYADDPGDTAILESPEIEHQDDRVLGFYYHMYGASMGSLYVDVYDGEWHNGVWSLSGEQHSSSSDTYSKATVYLNNYTGPVKIRFRGVATGGSQGDMAIDDIEVVSGRSYGDFTGDTVVNDSDLDTFSGRWLIEDCENPDGLDLDGNCMLSFYEYALMAENWLK